jgi:hypothetical protein
MLVAVGRRRADADAPERRRGSHAIGDEAEDHADTGSAEAVVPADLFPQDAGDQRRGECADIDPHVEDREACIPARTALRVQIANDRRDVRLEQPGSDDDENEAEEECRPRED